MIWRSGLKVTRETDFPFQKLSLGLPLLPRPICRGSSSIGAHEHANPPPPPEKNILTNWIKVHLFVHFMYLLNKIIEIFFINLQYKNHSLTSPTLLHFLDTFIPTYFRRKFESFQPRAPSVFINCASGHMSFKIKLRDSQGDAVLRVHCAQFAHCAPCGIIYFSTH